jgi:hypothetical protein
MRGEKRAPSLDRSDPLSNSIVKILDDLRGGHRVDGGNAYFRPCRRKGRDEEADLIEPRELGGVVASGRRIDIDNSERQQQNEHVFLDDAHAPPSRLSVILPFGSRVRFTFSRRTKTRNLAE